MQLFMLGGEPTLQPGTGTAVPSDRNNPRAPLAKETKSVWQSCLLFQPQPCTDQPLPFRRKCHFRDRRDKNCSPEARLTPAKHSACEGICLQVSRQRKANAISRCAAADPPRPPAACHQRPLQRQREERQQTLLLMPQSHRSPAAPWGCLVGQQDRLCPSAHHPSAAEGQPC